MKLCRLCLIVFVSGEKWKSRNTIIVNRGPDVRPTEHLESQSILLSFSMPSREILQFFEPRINFAEISVFVFFFNSGEKKSPSFSTHCNLNQNFGLQLWTLHRTTYSIKLKIGFLAASNAHIPSHHYFPSRPFVTNLHERIGAKMWKRARARNAALEFSPKKWRETDWVCVFVCVCVCARVSEWDLRAKWRIAAMREGGSVHAHHVPTRRIGKGKSSPREMVPKHIGNGSSRSSSHYISL